MSFIKEFKLLLKARYPILYIPTSEEERVEYVIRSCVQLYSNRGIYAWDFVDGYTNDPNTNNLAARNPLQALEFIEKLNPTRPAIFILKDFNRFLTDITISRKLRNLNRTLKVSPKTIFIIASDLELQIPDELNELITVVDFLLPQYNETLRARTMAWDRVQDPMSRITMGRCRTTGTTIPTLRTIFGLEMYSGIK